MAATLTSRDAIHCVVAFRCVLQPNNLQRKHAVSTGRNACGNTLERGHMKPPKNPALDDPEHEDDEPELTEEDLAGRPESSEPLEDHTNLKDDDA